MLCSIWRQVAFGTSRLVVGMSLQFATNGVIVNKTRRTKNEAPLAWDVSTPWLRLHDGFDDTARHRCEGHELIKVHPAVLHAVALRPVGSFKGIVSSYCGTCGKCTSAYVGTYKNPFRSDFVSFFTTPYNISSCVAAMSGPRGVSCCEDACSRDRK